MPISKNQILEFLKKSIYRPVKIKELAREMKISPAEYHSFRRQVKDLISEGHLIKLKKNRLGLPDKLSLKIGKLAATKGGFGFVIPDDGSGDIYIPPESFNSAQVGQKVVVEIESWSDPHLSPEGKIIEVIGFPEEKGIDILTIIKEFQLPLDFPPAVIREVEKSDPAITPAEIKNRKDFRKLNCFTIDPINAKDHDDAVSIQKLKNGNWLLGVHIADVYFYVKEN